MKVFDSGKAFLFLPSKSNAAPATMLFLYICQCKEEELSHVADTYQFNQFTKIHYIQHNYYLSNYIK